MVAKDVLQKRIRARAELSTLQIIRDVAHDMGITTDELLIQRTLERLPDAKNRQSVAEIASVLQMLRAQQPKQLDAPIEPPDPVHHAVEPDLPPVIEHRPPPIAAPPIINTSYVEGIYEPINDNDPDADDDRPKGIYSPFQ